MVFRYILPFACVLLFISSCKNGGPESSRGPIILGDSNTIVTETDSENLKDAVTDIKPVETQPQEETTAKNSQEPAPGQQKTATYTAQPGSGLTVSFKEVTVLIPGISTKSYRNQNPQHANGASYQLTGGNLNGNQVKITSGNVTKVSQRYQTIIAIKNNLGTLPLDALSTTTDWQPLKGSSTTWYISGLDQNHLIFTKASTSAIRNAVTRAARAHRLSSRRARQFMESIKNARATNQAPMVVVLKSVMYKIEGKNAQGKPYQKQLRIDMPF